MSHVRCSSRPRSSGERSQTFKFKRLESDKPYQRVFKNEMSVGTSMEEELKRPLFAFSTDVLKIPHRCDFKINLQQNPSLLKIQFFQELFKGPWYV